MMRVDDGANWVRHVIIAKRIDLGAIRSKLSARIVSAITLASSMIIPILMQSRLIIMSSSSSMGA